jgi:hypothetical protein
MGHAAREEVVALFRDLPYRGGRVGCTAFAQVIVVGVDHSGLVARVRA